MTTTLLKNRSFTIPPFIQACINGGGINARYPRPLRDAQSLSSAFNDSNISSIARLFGSGGPAAVSRLIVSVIVNAFNRMARGWLCSHVSQKVSEIRPSLAHRNAAIAVVFVLVIAPTQHIGPSCVFRSPRLAGFSKSVLERRRPLEFTRHTPAAFAAGGCQVAVSKYLGGSAFAAAMPHAPTIDRVRISNHKEHSELLPGNVCAPRSLRNTIAFSHNFLLARNSGQRRRGVISASSPRFLRGTSIVADCQMEAIHG